MYLSGLNRLKNSWIQFLHKTEVSWSSTTNSPLKANHLYKLLMNFVAGFTTFFDTLNDQVLLKKCQKSIVSNNLVSKPTTFLKIKKTVCHWKPGYLSVMDSYDWQICSKMLWKTKRLEKGASLEFHIVPSGLSFSVLLGLEICFIMPRPISFYGHPSCLYRDLQHGVA